jgi:hypothetical protein
MNGASTPYCNEPIDQRPEASSVIEAFDQGAWANWGNNWNNNAGWNGWNNDQDYWNTWDLPAQDPHYTLEYEYDEHDEDDLSDFKVYQLLNFHTPLDAKTQAWIDEHYNPRPYALILTWSWIILFLTTSVAVLSVILNDH